MAPPTAPNNLFLRVDGRAAARNYYLMSSHIDTKNSPLITKEMFVSLAKQAWEEMKHSWRNVAGNTRAPSVMTVMYDRAGQDLYFSSSVRKSNPAESWLRLFPPIDRKSQLVVMALQACGLEDGGDTTHPNKANCGEMLVIHQWAITNPGKGLGALRDFWLVTVSRKDGSVYVKSPCDVNQKGCQLVLGPMGLDIVAEGMRIPPRPIAYPLAFRQARPISITEISPCPICCGIGYQSFGGYEIPCCGAPAIDGVRDARLQKKPVRDESSGFLRKWP